MRDLTQHLTTRADDNHAPPVSSAPKGRLHYIPVQRDVKTFILANVLPRWNTYCVCDGTGELCPPTPGIHRLPRGLPGYLILFAPHAFEPQRQLPSSKPPSPLVFLLISTHFTATLGIPLTSPALQPDSFQCNSEVEPPPFTSDLLNRLRSLYTQ